MYICTRNRNKLRLVWWVFSENPRQCLDNNASTNRKRAVSVEKKKREASSDGGREGMIYEK